MASKHVTQVNERLMLSRREVASMLGVCCNFLLQQEQRGLFPAGRRLGRRVLYSRQDVENWVRNGINVVGGGARAGCR